MTAAWCQHSISVYVCAFALFVLCACVRASECALVSPQTDKEQCGSFARARPPLVGVCLVSRRDGEEGDFSSGAQLSLFSCSDSRLTFLFLSQPMTLWL